MKPSVGDKFQRVCCLQGAGIVFECESYIPNKVGYFHEFNSERLSVALKETKDDDVEPGFLLIAYNWSWTRAVQGYVDLGTAFDSEEDDVNQENGERDRRRTRGD